MKKIFILLLTLVSLNVIVYAGTEVVNYNCTNNITTQDNNIQQEELNQELQHRREARLRYWNKVQEQKLKQKKQEEKNNIENTQDTAKDNSNKE